MPHPVAPPPAFGNDRLAVVYQLKIHLVGTSPHSCWPILVRGDTTLAQLHHVFQVVMGWENWHLHSFHLWGKAQPRLLAITGETYADGFLANCPTLFDAFDA